jgi:hypothetical protein
MLFGNNQRRKEIDIEKHTAQVSVGDNFILKSNVQHLEELVGGVIVYASLDKEIGMYSLCIEKYKVIVEPPTLWEKFLGITLDIKIKKAVRKLKAECHAAIRQDREPFSFNFNSLMPKFQAFVI